MKQINIQTAQTDDYPQIIQLLQMLAQEEGMMCMLDAAQLGQALQFGNPKLEAIVAKNGDETLGCAMFYAGFDVLSSTYGVHISDIIVRKNARNQQIGRKLMQQIAKYSVKQGGEWLSWTVDKRNIGAKNFYLKLGAQTINVDFMAMGITNMRILMEKT